MPTKNTPGEQTSFRQLNFSRRLCYNASTMDQVASPEPEAPSPAPAEPASVPSPASAPQQIVDVVSAPARTAEEDAAVAATSTDQQPPALAMPVKPKAALSSDVKIAIIATVFIVVVLGILATLAFLKQK